MKKIVSILLVACLILSVSVCAFAEDKKPRLQFRGVDFGTTYKEAVKIWADGGLTEEFSVKQEEDCCYEVTYPEYLTVAGFDNMIMVAYFKWESLDNTSVDDSVLVEAKYLYLEEMTDTDKISKAVSTYHKELKGKLSQLYGSCKYDDDNGLGRNVNPRTQESKWEHCFENQFAKVDLVTMFKAKSKQVDAIIMIDYFDVDMQNRLRWLQDDYYKTQHDVNSKDGL